MSEPVHPFLRQTLLRILEHTYDRYPWKSDHGEDIPQDIALDPSGALPVWWNQMERTAELLDISPEALPAVLVEDPDTLTGKRLEWRSQVSATPAEDLLLRTVLPSLALDCARILHAQENVLALPRHLGMFSDPASLMHGITKDLPPEQLMKPLARESLPMESVSEDRLESETPTSSPTTPEPLRSDHHGQD